MHTPGTFALFIQPGDEQTPARVKVMIQRHADADGRVFITLDCLSLDELESCINALQDDLDQLRSRAKRAFDHRG